MTTQALEPPAIAQAAQLVACKTCGQVHQIQALPEGFVANCVRCGSRLARRTHGSFHLTGALALAALILYIPANVFPILQIQMYGATSQNTVWDGAVRLFQDGDTFIAVVVLLASILIPALKLLGLFLLVITSRLHLSWGRKFRTLLYKTIEGVGRWAMLDVFVVAVLVSLVKLQKLATIIPGPGLLAFTGVVVLTLLASASFDPQLIWESPQEGQ